MPTPFYHLSLAEELLQHPDLPAAIADFLHSARAEFLFGTTAPDVQVVSGQPRQDTHFFNLPILAGDRPAWDEMLIQYPALAKGEGLPASLVAFMTGYLCHLQADWWWIKHVFAPFFGPMCSWGTFRQRLYYHNVLRAYLDLHTLPSLSEGLGEQLSRVEPDTWLPFVGDGYLMKWRNFLYPQLQRGAAIQTVEVFSSRQGISAADYYALLDSEERMQQEIFIHLRPDSVRSFRQHVIEENMLLISNYLAFTLHPMNTLIVGRCSKELSHETDRAE